MLRDAVDAEVRAGGSPSVGSHVRRTGGLNVATRPAVTLREADESGQLLVTQHVAFGRMTFRSVPGIVCQRSIEMNQRDVLASEARTSLYERPCTGRRAPLRRAKSAIRFPLPP